MSNAQATSSSTLCETPGRDDVVARLVVLEHQPHRADVVARVAPVAARGEVAEHELVLEAERDRGRRPRHLPGEEVDRPERRLVVVEDPAAREHAVAPPVARGDEVRVGLGDAVRRQRARRRRLRLRRLARLAEDLARRRLVEADRGIDLPDRLEHRRRADGGELRRQDRLVPGARHEGGGGEVVDLRRPRLAQGGDERGAVEQVRLARAATRPSSGARASAYAAGSRRTTPATS